MYLYDEIIEKYSLNRTELRSQTFNYWRHCFAIDAIENHFFTIPRVAYMLGVKHNTVYNLIKNRYEGETYEAICRPLREDLAASYDGMYGNGH